MPFTARTVAHLAVWGAAVLLGANALRLYSGRRVESSSVQAATAFPLAIRIPPSYVELRSYAADENGKRHVATTIRAVRSDGSFVTRYELLHTQASVQRVIRLAAGEVVVTNDTLHQALRRPRAVGIPPDLRDPSSQCLNRYDAEPMNPQESLRGTSQINGYHAVELGRRLKDVELREWYAPSLGCALLRQTAPERVTEAVVVRPGEPPEVLFAVPAHYQVVTPEQMNRERPADQMVEGK